MRLLAIILAGSLSVMLNGCISVKDIHPHTIYSDIKLVYKDVKYVVYEIEEEKKRIDEEGFGEK